MAEYYKAWEKEVSAIRIGNASQLESFLKILSEERAQEDVLPEKQKSMEKAIERDLKRYSKIEEQEDEEGPEAEEDEPEEDSPPEEEGEDVDDEDVDVSPPEQDDSGEEEVVSPDITYYKILPLNYVFDIKKNYLIMKSIGY